MLMRRWQPRNVLELLGLTEPMKYESLYNKSESWPVLRDIFALRFPEAETVLDLTYGLGTFWKWDYPFKLHKNDWVTEADTSHDFIDYPAARYDVVVFDPPFSAIGPPSDGKGDWSARYGASRAQGGPQNIKEVVAYTLAGIESAMRIARCGVILKTQRVIESMKLHDVPHAAKVEIYSNGWEVSDHVYLHAPKRPQPPGRRVLNFRNVLSEFIVAVPG